MATGTGKHGNTVSAGDDITIHGIVTVVLGTGSNATVTVVSDAGDTFAVKAKDCYAPQTDGVAISRSGKGFGVGDRVSIPAQVTAVSGAGKTASLTSTVSSGASVSHAASVVNSPKKN